MYGIYWKKSSRKRPESSQSTYTLFFVHVQYLALNSVPLASMSGFTLVSTATIQLHSLNSTSSKHHVLFGSKKFILSVFSRVFFLHFIFFFFFWSQTIGASIAVAGTLAYSLAKNNAAAAKKAKTA